MTFVTETFKPSNHKNCNYSSFLCCCNTFLLPVLAFCCRSCSKLYAMCFLTTFFEFYYIIFMYYVGIYVYRDKNIIYLYIFYLNKYKKLNVSMIQMSVLYKRKSVFLHTILLKKRLYSIDTYCRILK